jgi:hypothetical protein
MHSSSEAIGTIAAALAKAQAELINPEKSLVGTIRSPSPRDGDRTFRYAPLSSGLDIVRKSLGKHEIATIQSTVIDKEVGLLRLTTVLAHSSGEWIASEWPVCPIAETASPQRMGAALTYARRYALFTLVGIAGEDDLDAPDICTSAPVAGSAPPRVPSTTELQAVLQPPPTTHGNGRMSKATKAAIPELSPEESAALRDRLLAEIAAFQTQDRITHWAREAIAAKNRLTAADAKLVEDAFQQKLPKLPATERATTTDGAHLSDAHTSQQELVSRNGQRDRSHLGIDKSTLTVAAPRRYRNREHLRFVMQQPCLLCARKPSDAHHIRFAQPRALGRKTSDEFTVPLCRTHHRAVHRAGNEEGWWKQAGIDPLKVARKLWKQARTNEGRLDPTPAQAATSDGRSESDRHPTNTQPSA